MSPTKGTPASARRGLSASGLRISSELLKQVFTSVPTGATSPARIHGRRQLVRNLHVTGVGLIGSRYSTIRLEAATLARNSCSLPDRSRSEPDVDQLRSIRSIEADADVGARSTCCAIPKTCAAEAAGIEASGAHRIRSGRGAQGRRPRGGRCTALRGAETLVLEPGRWTGRQQHAHRNYLGFRWRDGSEWRMRAVRQRTVRRVRSIATPVTGVAFTTVLRGRARRWRGRSWQSAARRARRRLSCSKWTVRTLKGSGGFPPRRRRRQQAGAPEAPWGRRHRRIRQPSWGPDSASGVNLTAWTTLQKMESTSPHD